LTVDKAAHPSVVSSTAELRQHVKAIRKDILSMIHASGASHVGPALSCAEIMACLYFDVARIDPSRPLDPGRDRIILSKGHAVASWYAALAERKFFPKALLSRYYQDGSPLMAHPDLQSVPGIEASTGSLGHGLPVGIGMALAGKIDRAAYHVFVIVGDGECNEGTIWESALAAPQLKLDNLTVIIDRNRQQGLGDTESIIALEPLEQKWSAFGWHVLRVDGHDVDALLPALRHHEPGRPVVIIADTVKGKGVSYMENQLLWHYRNPNDEQYAQAIKEIDDA
jgi:transketolase